MSRPLLIAGLLVLGACLGPSLVHAAEPPPLATIDLAPAGVQWRVRYTLPEATTALRFSRPDRHGNRAKGWTAVDPAFEIVLDGDEEVLRRKDGRAFRRAAFDMAPRYASLEKDYAPFSPFGDGGLLVHTGRFHACPERCAEGGTSTWRVRLAPPAGAHAIAGGKVVRKVELLDRDPGTNVYVGRATPVQSADVVAVVDATLPEAARARLASLLPRLMALYGDELGMLADKPMLFASNDAAHPGGGYGYQGGTLPGQVFMHLYGRHEAFGKAEFAARMDWFFAHEAAHLYQRYVALEDTGQTWIHEGGADALAAVALERLGVVAPAAVAARVEAAVAGCASGIAKHPLSRAHVEGSFETYYQCGFVMQMAVDAAARRASNGECGLFCVWRDFRRRVEAGAAWNTDTFTAVVAAHADAGTAAFVRAAATEVPAQPHAFLREGLRQAGVTLGAERTQAAAR